MTETNAEDAAAIRECIRIEGGALRALSSINSEAIFRCLAVRINGDAERICLLLYAMARGGCFFRTLDVLDGDCVRAYTIPLSFAIRRAGVESGSYDALNCAERNGVTIRVNGNDVLDAFR